jgi:hypothetical protein
LFVSSAWTMLLLWSLPRSSAQNAVGYVNTALTPGLNLISNPLIPLDPALNRVIRGSPPNGTTVHFASSTGYVTVRYDAASSNWTPPEAAELPLLPGDGFFILNPTASVFTITFVGTISSGRLTNHIPAGFSIQSSIVPQAAGLDVLGFPAEAGDMVFLYDEAEQKYKGYIFDEFGLQWRPSTPRVDVGEAFFVLKRTAVDWVRQFSIIPPHGATSAVARGGLLNLAGSAILNATQYSPIARTDSATGLSNLD